MCTHSQLLGGNQRQLIGVIAPGTPGLWERLGEFGIFYVSCVCVRSVEAKGRSCGGWGVGVCPMLGGKRESISATNFLFLCVGVLKCHLRYPREIGSDRVQTW